MRKPPLIPLILVAALGFALAGEADPLLDLGTFVSEAPEAPLPERMRLVSYNLHGPPTKRIPEMIELLQSHPALKDAPILSLQEVNRDHSGSGNKDMARELAQALKMHFAYAVEIEHGKGGGVRGLAILSRYPLSQVERVQLPVEGPGGRRRIALGATVELGQKRLRVYSLHLETRISAKKRVLQLQGLLDNARKYSDLPIAVLGDFNTYASGHTRRVFQLMEEDGFRCPLKGDKKTIQKAFFVRLKLDWIFLKNLTPLAADVEAQIAVSDHRPLWVDIDTASLP